MLLALQQGKTTFPRLEKNHREYKGRSLSIVCGDLYAPATSGTFGIMSQLVLFNSVNRARPLDPLVTSGESSKVLIAD
jgi:hypothetical protein